MTQSPKFSDDKPTGEIVIYQTDDGKTKIEVRFVNETVWLTQALMAQLFGTSVPNINIHIRNILKDGELDANSVIKEFLTTAADGKNYRTKYYNLDMIISVGYRIKSTIATQFRIWATSVLKEYIIKGFALDDDRLKGAGGGGYWKELLERIRDIRASEKVFYRQILDIYATSIDYDPCADESIAFFKKVQNKIHYAVHGQTAAEVIYMRADAEKEFMSQMSFSGSRPHLADAVIAKNYLSADELRALGQIVSGYLDFAERQAERHVPMTMRDWRAHLDGILTATGEKLLADAGKISHEKAVEKAQAEYVKYQTRTLSDAEKQYLASLKKTEAALKRRIAGNEYTKSFYRVKSVRLSVGGYV